MKKIVCFIIILMALLACQEQKQQEAGYIVQVSLGGWQSPDYTADQIIGRIDTVSQLIPVKKVIIGWSQDKEIYRKVGEYLHAKNIRMLLWLPVFAETEEAFCVSKADFTRMEELFRFNGIPHYETITPDGRRVRDDLRINGYHSIDFELNRLKEQLKD